MKEYTPKQVKELKSNPYTLKVTRNKLYFTIKFKEDFWISYQAGNAPRKILTDFGYDLECFGQKQTTKNSYECNFRRIIISAIYRTYAK